MELGAGPRPQGKSARAEMVRFLLQDQLKSILRHGTGRLPEDDKILPSEKGDVHEKQLSTAFEHNIVRDYDGVDHRKETDLIIHSLRSQKTVLEQRLREMLNEPEQL